MAVKEKRGKEIFSKYVMDVNQWVFEASKFVFDNIFSFRKYDLLLEEEWLNFHESLFSFVNVSFTYLKCVWGNYEQIVRDLLYEKFEGFKFWLK